MSFAANLKRLREEAGLTQEQLALRCGWSGQSRIANYESASPNARQPRADEVLLIAIALGRSVGELFGEEVVDSGWSSVRGYNQTAALGDGALPDAYAEAHKLKFRASSLRKKGLNPDNLHVYYGDGDSMEPRIHDGDAILFDTSDTRIMDNRIYVIRYDGHVYAKRLQVHGDLVFIESDNTADPKWRRPILVQPEDDFEVIGRVRWIGSWEG